MATTNPIAKSKYYVTYRTDVDGPTSTCIALAACADDVLAHFVGLGRAVVSITPEGEAPSWMGEGKRYSTVECPRPSRASGADFEDGEECTELFHAWEGSLPAEWARQSCPDSDVRLFLGDLLGTDCTPMEGGSLPGEHHVLDFRRELDGLGYRLTYRFGKEDAAGFVTVHDVHVYRNGSWDRECGEAAPDEGARRQYRITFHGDAARRVDPFELAWLLSKHEVDVVAKNEVPMLFVRAGRDGLLAFAHEVNRQFGPLVFESIEVADVELHAYVEVDFAA